MRKIIAGLLALAVWTSPAPAQYIPYEVDFADGSLSAPLNTSVGNTPTIRVYYKQDGTNFNPSSYESYLKWGKDDSAVDGMVTVPGVNNTNGYSDFFCATNTFGRVVKDGYWSVYLTRSNGTQNITAIRANGGLQVERSPEISNAMALQRTTAINWDLLVNTGTLPWVSYAVGANTDVYARLQLPILGLLGTNAYNAATNAQALALIASNLSAQAFAWGNHATNGYLAVESDPMWQAGTGALWTAINSKATGDQWRADTERIGLVASNALAGLPSLAGLSNAAITVVGTTNQPSGVPYLVGNNTLLIGTNDSTGVAASSPTGTISVNHLIVTSTNSATREDAAQIEIREGNAREAFRVSMQRSFTDTNHYVGYFLHNASLTNGGWGADDTDLPASRMGIENNYFDGSRRAHEFNWDVDNAGDGIDFRRVFNMYAYSDGVDNGAGVNFYVPRFWFQSDSAGLTNFIISAHSDNALYAAGWPYIRTASDLVTGTARGMVIGSGYGHVYLQHDIGFTNHVIMGVPAPNLVGIGTTNPTSKLTVGGTITAQGLVVGTGNSLGTGSNNVPLVGGTSFGNGSRGNVSAGQAITVNASAMNTFSWGSNNVVNGHAVVAGGRNSYAGQNYASAHGGYAPRVEGVASTIAGGWGNTNSTASYASILGGWWNRADGTYATVGGGATNWALAIGSTIPGGGGMTIASTGDYSFAYNAAPTNRKTFGTKQAAAFYVPGNFHVFSGSYAADDSVGISATNSVLIDAGAGTFTTQVWIFVKGIRVQ